MRGQTALELVLIAAVVVVVAGLSFVAYTDEAQKTVAMATIRTQAELALAKASVEYPACASAMLANITYAGTIYTLGIIPEECADDAFPTAKLGEIQGRVVEALGCPYTEDGHCKGKVYNVLV